MTINGQYVDLFDDAPETPSRLQRAEEINFHLSSWHYVVLHQEPYEFNLAPYCLEKDGDHGPQG